MYIFVSTCPTTVKTVCICFDYTDTQVQITHFMIDVSNPTRTYQTTGRLLALSRDHQVMVLIHFRAIDVNDLLHFFSLALSSPPQ